MNTQTCSKKLIKTANPAYNEKVLTAGIGETLPRRKAADSEIAVRDTLGATLLRALLMHLLMVM